MKRHRESGIQDRSIRFVFFLFNKQFCMVREYKFYQNKLSIKANLKKNKKHWKHTKYNNKKIKSKISGQQ